MRTAAYEADVAMRPPQARVSQAKLFVLNALKRGQVNGHTLTNYHADWLGGRT